jgi:hypothetical protein
VPRHSLDSRAGWVRRQKAVVVFVAFLISIIGGLAAALTMDNMVEDAGGWACLAVGCGAWLAMFFGSAGIIGLFEFTDTRAPAVRQVPPNPNQSGTPVA